MTISYYRSVSTWIDLDMRKIYIPDFGSFLPSLSPWPAFCTCSDGSGTRFLPEKEDKIDKFDNWLSKLMGISGVLKE